VSTKSVASFVLAMAFLIITGGQSTAYDCSEAKYQADHQRMDMAFKTGILRNDTGGDSVFISEAYWRGLSFAQKNEFADALVCAVAGAGKGLRSMRFRSDMTGKLIGDWNMGTLTVP
jgi:hypothetical protein